MRAVAKTEGKTGFVSEIEAATPEVGAGEVLIQVAGCGVCGTDVHIYDWPDNIAKEYAPEFPVIMGHEFAGTILELGEGVPGLEKGQAVAINPHLYCGKCSFCTSGRSVLCDNRPIMGCNRDGGWAEMAVVPGENAYPLPPGVDPIIGALVEPLSVAVHAVLERAPLSPGDTVLIMGPGPVGLLHILVARAAGAANIVVAGISSDRERLDLAGEFGAIPVDSQKEDVLAVLRELAPQGADVSYETSGHPDALHTAIEGTRKGGRVALIGFADDPIPIDTLHLVVKEKELIGVRAYDRNTWIKSVPLLARLAPELERLISHSFSFSEIDKAFKLIRAQECLKVIIRPDL